MKYLIGLTAIVLHAAWSGNCFALNVQQANQSLRITGDKGNDLIEIVDNGAGSLSVNGTEHVDVLRLVIETKGGHDRVTYDTVGELSVSKIQIDLGAGDDIAELNLGVIGADVQSEIHGGAGRDEITTFFGEVPAGVAAESLMEGELGDDIVTCVQHNVAGCAACIGRGGAGNDQLFCHADEINAGGQAECIADGGIGDDTITCAKSNVAGLASCSSDGGPGNDHIFCRAEDVEAGGQAECVSDGGIGDDTIACTKSDIAGFASCVSDGGAGNDNLSCVLAMMTATGSGLCDQSGETGNDTLRCETSDIEGEHVCFEDGGAGNDVVNSIVKGNNSPDSECTMYGGLGDDVLNIELGTFDVPITVQTGPVTFFADAGNGNDHLTTTANLTDESDATISSVTVLMGRGNDTVTLDFLSLGNGVLEDQVYDGGQGIDTYEGTVPAMFLPLVNFEVGV